MNTTSESADAQLNRAERISPERLRELRDYWVADGHPIVGELLDEVERMYAERDDDLCVMTAYLRPNSRGEAAWVAILANHFGPRAQELVEDSGRFAAAYSRVNQLPPITIKPEFGCYHGPDRQCIECVPDDGVSFQFQPLGPEGGTR